MIKVFRLPELDQILIRNDGHERPLVAKLNLKEVSSKGEPDVLLKSFDVVYVPMTKIARVDRFVDQHLKQTLPVSLTAGFTYFRGNTGAVFSPR